MNSAAKPLLAACALALAACAGKPPPLGAPPPPAKATAGPVKIGKPYTVFGRTYLPKDDRDYDERGIASWYGPGFHALATANGETYDQNDLTAAHKTLPMPSFVEVENLDNGRKLTVRINDRGPFVEGRIIDLSRRSAQLLGVDKVGLARVRVRRVFPDGQPAPPEAAPIDTPTVRTVDLPASPPQPASPPANPYFVQVAALSDPGRVAWLGGFLGAFGPVATQPAPGGLTRVRLGPYAREAEALKVLSQIRTAGYPNARLIKP
ncbi:MAG: septal ring lytic transglycosylase RlpA family protein [Polymorphobacter sp.]|uniref:septal ring lytic transglycosylase RlpA family protein n=1 Tax=Polymorphobacter sp. TaxID=1909290 RepID=UPI003A87786A